MSFHISKAYTFESGSFSKTLYQVTPSDQLLSELPFSKNLKIEPSYSVTPFNMFLQAIIDFDIHSSDVFVCSLPKCGSSWMQTIVWLLTNALNYESTKTLNRFEQFGDFDEIVKVNSAEAKVQELLTNKVSYSLDEDEARKIAFNDLFETIDTPRVFKSHNTIYFLPKAIWSRGAKVIYVVRNPKDMIVSMYHYYRNVLHVECSIDHVVNRLIGNRLHVSPALNHILNYWRVRHLPNVLFVAYEDLVNDAFSNIKRISEFLQCKYTDEQLKELTEYVSFDKMKKNEAINREEDLRRMERVLEKKRPDPKFTFLRKGKVGSYLDDLNDDQIHKIDHWVRNGLKDTDFRFKI